MTQKVNHNLVLGFSPTTRGIGYAVFEGPQNPLDWGVKGSRADTTGRVRESLRDVIRFYSPDVIVVEKQEKAYRRGLRARQLIKEVSAAARQCRVEIYVISKDTVEGVFSQFNATTKFQRAVKIIEWIPDLKLLRPRERKPWMSEDYRMGIFDAMTLALTYYYIEN